MNDDHKYYIPRYIDEPAKVILWTIDEFVVFVIPFFTLFFYFDAPITAVMIGVSLVFLLKKIKGEQGHHFLLHVAYWYLPEIIKLKQTPPSHLRSLVG